VKGEQKGEGMLGSPARGRRDLPGEKKDSSTLTERKKMLGEGTSIGGMSIG